MFESEFSEILESKLKDAYGDLYDEYILKRYMLIYRIKDYRDVNLSKLALYIANLLSANVISNSYFLYKNTKFYISACYQQSIENILINWPLFASFKIGYSKDKLLKLQNEAKAIISSNWKRIRPKRISYIQKEYYYIYEALTMLNSQYNIFPKKFYIDNICLAENEFTARTLEEVAEIYIKDLKFHTSNNELVLEKEIEDFLHNKFSAEYPNCIFTRQVQISNGNIVDILVKNKENNDLTIIEIKNKKDDRLYWQVVKYKESIPTAEIVVMAPEYDKLMIEKIKKLGYVKLVEFKLSIEMGKIKDVLLILI